MRRKPLAATIAAVLAAALAIATPGTAHADDTRDGQWYLNTFDIDKVHELSQGAGVTIGIIDSGVDADHQDLEGNIEAGAQINNTGVVDGDGLDDSEGHGTAVASTLVGHGHGEDGSDGILGIAPKATVVSAGINWDDVPSQQKSETVAQALTWMVDQDVDVISISLGVYSTPEGESALEEAAEKGIPVVGAAGNRYVDTGSWGTVEDKVTNWPARGKGAIPVSGITDNGTYWKDGVDLADAVLSPQLGLSAPAVDIPIALPNNKYDTVNGTSFSAPIVAGTLALIKSAYPKLDYYQWTDRLLDTVDDKGDDGFDDKYGWGIVNPYNALTEETVYEDETGDQVSSPDDRLPLDEQGKDTGDDEGDTSPGDDSATSDDSAAALDPESGVPAWAIIAAAAAVLAIAAVALTLIIRHRKKNTGPHQAAAPAATTTGIYQQTSTPPPAAQQVLPGQLHSGQRPSGVPQPPAPDQPQHPGQPPAGPPPPDQNPYLNRPPS